MIQLLSFAAPLLSMLVATSPLAGTSPLSGTSPLPRTGQGALRVVTWNIGANSVVPPRFSAGGGDANEADTRSAAFQRVIRALDADVVCLQELTIGPERAAALFDAAHPLPGGKRWQAVSQLGNVLVSRYPLTDRRGATLRHRLSQRGHVIARVQVPGLGADAPVVACMHLQAKGGADNVAFRTRHATAVVHDLGDMRGAMPGPVIALGDMNAIDHPAPYLRTLEAGDGQSAAFPLVPALATHNGSGADSYTWRNDHSGFAPGVLDYILFTERRFVPRAAFVLNTMTMSATERASSGLHAGDALRNGEEYDHLPVVADLELRK